MAMTITISAIQEHGSIAAAIEAACAESDTTASGVIGPEFSTSGPGAGWSKTYDATDFAERALSGDDGALYYIDPDDGRLATLKDEDLVWTEETVVEVVDDLEDVSEETMKLLEAAIESGHVVSDVSTRCTCSSCGCDELATHWDSDAGDRVCEECSEYVCDEDGEAMCSRDERTEYVSDGGRTYLRIRPPEMPDEDPGGAWALCWSTAGDESRVESRFSTREEAEQAVAAADWPRPGNHTQYPCGYEVRHLEDGEWVRVDD